MQWRAMTAMTANGAQWRTMARNGAQSRAMTAPHPAESRAGADDSDSRGRARYWPLDSHRLDSSRAAAWL
jgi:hypothetical protein